MLEIMFRLIVIWVIWDVDNVDNRVKEIVVFWEYLILLFVFM